ncbi:MAG: zinc-ribbon domain-containing protein [Lachnospiraceae bacterium]
MSENNDLITCPYCGSQNPSTFRFCSNCGERLNEKKKHPFRKHLFLKMLYRHRYRILLQHGALKQSSLLQKHPHLRRQKVKW